MKSIIPFLVFCIFSSTSLANELSDANKLFDYAESIYPVYFTPEKSPTFELEGFLARRYFHEDTQSDIYLGVKDQNVYVYNEILWGGLLDVGHISDFVETTPTIPLIELPEFSLSPSFLNELSDANKLFDYAESIYPMYFTPEKSPTFELEGFLARRYFHEDTQSDIYLGVKDQNVYIYNENLWGGLLDAGHISDLPSLSNILTRFAFAEYLPDGEAPIACYSFKSDNSVVAAEKDGEQILEYQLSWEIIDDTVKITFDEGILLAGEIPVPPATSDELPSDDVPINSDLPEEELLLLEAEAEDAMKPEPPSVAYIGFSDFTGDQMTGYYKWADELVNRDWKIMDKDTCIDLLIEN